MVALAAVKGTNLYGRNRDGKLGIQNGWGKHPVAESAAA